MHMCYIRHILGLEGTIKNIGLDVKDLIQSKIGGHTSVIIDSYPEASIDVPAVHIHAVILDPEEIHEDMCNDIEEDVIKAMGYHLPNGYNILYTWDTVKGIARRVGEERRFIWRG